MIETGAVVAKGAEAYHRACNGRTTAAAVGLIREPWRKRRPLSELAALRASTCSKHNMAVEPASTLLQAARRRNGRRP